ATTFPPPSRSVTVAWVVLPTKSELDVSETATLVMFAPTAKLGDVAEANPFDANCRVNVPVSAMESPVNVATPFTALTVVCPKSAPVPLAIDAVTDAVDVGTLVLFASRTSTTGCTENATPETALAGAFVIASLLAAPTDCATVSAALPTMPSTV